MVLTLHADCVRLDQSIHEAVKCGILHVHKQSYLNFLLVISLPERTGQDRTGRKRQKGFLEGTEVSKKIISMAHKIPSK